VTPAADFQHVPTIPPCGGGSTSSTTTTTLPSACGNGTIEAGEDCDDGDTAFVRGDACSADCDRVACGDPDNRSAVNATDALIVLRVAVGLDDCDLCVCNVDSVGTFTSASDALRVLNAVVGLPVVLGCPLCGA
jgi:cysteine-rich repeat protein